MELERGMLEMVELKHVDSSPNVVGSLQQQQVDRCWIMQPFDSQVILWQSVVGLISIYYLFLIPMEFCFGVSDFNDILNNQFIFIMNIIIVIIYSLDILIQVNTAFYQHGELICSPTPIFFHYLKHGLLIDILAIIGILLQLTVRRYWAFIPKFIFILKFPRILHLNSKLQLILGDWPGLLTLYQLIKASLVFLYLAHLFGCCYYLLDYFFYSHPDQYPYRNDNMVWLVDSSCLPGVDMMVSLTWDQRYVYALYWSVQTSSTVGYGDITPRNPPQVIFVTLSMLIMALSFGYFLNQVWTIFYNWSKPLIQRNERSISFKRILVDSHIQKPLLYSSIMAADILQQIKTPIQQLSELKGALPYPLRIQLCLKLYSQFLESLPFLLTSSSKAKASVLVQQKVVTRSQPISFSQYFVWLSQGEVEHRIGNHTIQVQKEPGLLSFLQTYIQEDCKVRLRASATTVLYVISVNELLGEMEQGDRKNYKQIRESMMTVDRQQQKIKEERIEIGSIEEQQGMRQKRSWVKRGQGMGKKRRWVSNCQ